MTAVSENPVLWLLHRMKVKSIDYIAWRLKGRPLPCPHIIKEKTVQQYAKDYNLEFLVETGTFMGDMVCSTKGIFKNIISIELDPKLAEIAQKKFKNASNVNIICGDSGEKLAEVTKNLNGSALFWLDAHYSAGVTARGNKDTPIISELEAIFSNMKNGSYLLLIDDARSFIGENDYPELEYLKKYVLERDPNLEFFVEKDIIHFIPKNFVN